MSRIDNIGRNGNDGDHYFQRIEKYLVLNKNDISSYLSPEQLLDLESIIRKINYCRNLEDKDESPHYVVVKNTWPMYEEVWDMIEKWLDYEHEKYDRADDALSLGSKNVD